MITTGKDGDSALRDIYLWGSSTLTWNNVGHVTLLDSRNSSTGATTGAAERVETSVGISAERCFETATHAAHNVL